MHRYLKKFRKSESQDILRAEGLPCLLAWFQTRVLLSAKSSILYLAIVNKGFVNEKYFETLSHVYRYRVRVKPLPDSGSAGHVRRTSLITKDARVGRVEPILTRRGGPAAPSPAVGHAHSFFVSTARLNYSHPLQAILRAKHNRVHLSLQVQEYVAFLRIA